MFVLRFRCLRLLLLSVGCGYCCGLGDCGWFVAIVLITCTGLVLVCGLRVWLGIWCFLYLRCGLLGLGGFGVGFVFSGCDFVCVLVWIGFGGVVICCFLLLNVWVVLLGLVVW